MDKTFKVKWLNYRASAVGKTVEQLRGILSAANDAGASRIQIEVTSPDVAVMEELCEAAHVANGWFSEHIPKDVAERWGKALEAYRTKVKEMVSK